MTDRVLKALLLLAAVALLIFVLRPWLGATPAQAQAAGGGIPPPVYYAPPSAPPVLAVSQNGIAYVVSDGYITVYSVEGRARKLKNLGTERLPVAPGPPSVGGAHPGGFVPGFSGGY